MRCLFGTMSWFAGAFSCCLSLLPTTVGAAAGPPGWTFKGIPGWVRVRYVLASGSKKLKDMGGSVLMSALCGVITCSKVFVPCNPWGSAVSTFVVGGYVLKSCQAGWSGKFKESSDPRPVI